MKVIYGGIVLALAWVTYFIVSQFDDREGVTGALLTTGSQPSDAIFALGALLFLRFLCVVVLPALLVGWLLERLLVRMHKRFTRARS